MRCFIHNEVEAISVCKRCGKAMCANCSAYSGHSGICPECRRNNFIAERNNNYVLINNLKSERRLSVAWAILLSWTLIAIPYNIFKYRSKTKEIAKLEERNYKLTNEINKLNKILVDRGTAQFI
ncbi:MAG: hypothetical protein J6V66_02225 [Clostridia bacterium]|nr:hypothetical protein [Clostridia bacterium]